MATWNYGRAGLIDWRANRGKVAAVFAGASVGVIAVQMIDGKVLGLVIPLLLMACIERRINIDQRNTGARQPAQHL